MTVLCGTGNARGSTLAKQNHYFYQKPQKTQHTHGKMWGIMISGIMQWASFQFGILFTEHKKNSG